jgi:hypothetical protein
MPSRIMAFFRKDNRRDAGDQASATALEEPMEVTLADNGGLARLTFALTGKREAAGTWVTGTVEFVGFGVQVFLDDPMFKFDQLREFGTAVWQVADAQEGETGTNFEPSLDITVTAPSKRTSRLEVAIEFTLGTDANVNAKLQTDGTMAFAFCEALDRALEAIDEL